MSLIRLRIHQILLRGYELHTKPHLDRLRVNWLKQEKRIRSLGFKDSKHQRIERIPFLSDGELTIIYLLYELMSSSLILPAPAMQQQNQNEQPKEFFSPVFRLCTENHSKCNLSSPSEYRSGFFTCITNRTADKYIACR